MTTPRTKLLTSSVYSPTNPSSESAIRTQVDGSIQEVYDIMDSAKENVGAAATVQANLETHKTSSDHDGRYYTETELNNGQLDTRYYTEAEVNALLAAVTVGGLSPDSITDNYLKQTGNNILPNFNAHIADYVRQPGYGVTTGSANTYAITLSPAPTSYVDGMGIVAKINVANTGASTINVNSLGAKSIVDSKGNALTADKLKTTVSLKYNSTTGNFILQGEGGGGTATAGDILSGLTATVDSGLVTGTLALTGDATVADVVNGKTFYNTDAKTKLTGTGANAKRKAIGITAGHTYTGGETYTFVISGLPFTPSTITAKRQDVGNVWGFRGTPNGTVITGNNSGTYFISVASVGSGTFSLNMNAPAGTYQVEWEAIEQ